LCSLLQYPATSCHLGPNILISNLFSNTTFNHNCAERYFLRVCSTALPARNINFSGLKSRCPEDRVSLFVQHLLIFSTYRNNDNNNNNALRKIRAVSVPFLNVYLFKNSKSVAIRFRDSEEQFISFIGSVILCDYVHTLVREALTKPNEADEGVSKSSQTGRLERELQMEQLSATRCSCVAFL